MSDISLKVLEELNNLISQKEKKKLFVGIGNLLRSDDGAGVYICNRIKTRSGIMALTVEMSIENYIGKITSIDPDILILIDCIDMNSPAGSARLLKFNQIHDHTFNTHNISIKRLSEFFKMEVFLLGIQPERIDFGENISYLVKEVSDKIISLINKQEGTMAVEYLCKVCRGHLNVKTSIILAAAKLSNRSNRGLIYLNPELGNYTHTTHPSFQIKEGEEYIYTCPICSAQLNSMKYLHMVRVIMIDEKGKEYNIYFSGIAGEKCTYKIRGNKIEEKKGPDTEIYNKYFEVPEEDRKYL